MKRITVYNINLVEKIEEYIKDICFFVVDASEFKADMTDEYYEETKEELLNIIDSSGIEPYDYMVEDI